MSTINQRPSIGGSIAGTTEIEGQLSGSGSTGKMTIAQLAAKIAEILGIGGGGGDVTAPTIVSKTVENANPDKIVVVFSENVTVTTAGWSAKKNGSAWSISSVTGSGTTWTFTMGSNAANGDTLVISYNPATGATVDGSSNELGTLTDSAVTNNVAAGLAAAFIAAVEAGGTALSPTIESALATLETRINTIGASKFDAVYPFCGGAAQSHKWNFMNPLDTDAAFRGVFGGTVTHDANGITGSTDGYMDTKFNPSTHSTANNIHMAVYISNAGSGAPARFGSSSDSSANNLLIAPTISGSDYIRCYGTGGDGQIVYTNFDLTDSFILSRRANNDFEAYKGGVSQGTATGTTTLGSPPNANVTVLAENVAGTPGSFGAQTVQFFSIGKGLTDSEVTALHNAIVEFQTALSR